MPLVLQQVVKIVLEASSPAAGQAALLRTTRGGAQAQYKLAKTPRHHHPFSCCPQPRRLALLQAGKEKVVLLTRGGFPTTGESSERIGDWFLRAAGLHSSVRAVPVMQSSMFGEVFGGDACLPITLHSCPCLSTCFPTGRRVLCAPVL